MTVAEMIDRLKALNPSAVVMLGDGDKFGEGFSVRISIREEAQGKKVVIRDAAQEDR